MSTVGDLTPENEVTSADLGTKADASATTDTGTFSLIALIKRLLQKVTQFTFNGQYLNALVIGEVSIDPSQNQVVVTNSVAIADPTIPSGTLDTLTGVNDTVVKANTNGVPVIAWAITGTWVATIVFEVSNDNSNWFAIEGYNTNGWSTFTNTTANGMFLTDVPAKYIRLRMSAYTSGTATVTFQAHNTETPFVRARLSQASSAAGVSATDRFITTETDHQWIHQGLMFSLYRVFTALNNNQKVWLAMTTGVQTEHTVFTVFANYEVGFKIYEGSTTTKGSTLTEFNRNRGSSNTSLCTMQDVSAVTTAGTLLPNYLFGSQGGGASSVILPRGEEIILKASTEYLFEIVSKQNNNDVTLNINHYRTTA